MPCKCKRLNMLFAMFLVTLDQPEKITTEPQKAIEGNNVNLTCRATRYLYTDLQWLDSRNQTVTSSVSSLQFSRYSISLSLYLHNVSQNSTAGYKCRAYKLNKKAELKEALLILDGKLELYVIPLFPLRNSDSTNNPNFFFIFLQPGEDRG